MYGEQQRYHSTSIGTNSRLDEIQAAFLRVKLPRLDRWVERRQAVAVLYDDLLAGAVVIPPRLTGATHGRHLYPVQASSRDQVVLALRARDVPVAIHYPVGAHDQPCFANRRERALPVTERLCGTLLSLPMHPYVSDAQARAVATAVLDAVTDSG